MSDTFHVRIEPGLPPVVPEALSFETGASRAQAADPDLHVYEHHGEGFGQADPGALTSFFEDLILGRPMPLVFATPGINGLDTLVALSLFLHRDMAIAPSMAGFVADVDLVHRRGLALLGHVEEARGRFFRLLSGYISPGLSKRELGERLGTAVAWIRAYVMTGELPDLGRSWPSVDVLKVGTGGFVLAESAGSLLEGWVALYRQGFLKGVS